MNKDAPRVQVEQTHVCELVPCLRSESRPTSQTSRGGGIPRAALIVATLCSTVLLSGCASRRALRNDELYRKIQLHEARIAEAEVVVRAADNCIAAHGPAESGVCDESKALCKLTVNSNQTDAVRRCVLASDSCRAARERARTLCARPAD